MSRPLKALLIGCGYLGTRVGALFQQQGVHVTATTRSPQRAEELRALGFEPAILELSRVKESTVFRRYKYFDYVVYAVAPGRKGDSQLAFHDGLLHCLDSILVEGPPLPQRFVYVSTTGVYSERDGSWVDETTPAEPTEPRLQWVRRAEETLVELQDYENLSTVILRLGGIYGPNRSPYQWLRRPEVLARISKGNPQAYMNWVRVEDAAQATILASEKGRPGETYVLVDREPVQRQAFYTFAAKRAGIELPAFGTADDLGKRCSGEKARKELGFSPQYPTYREGLEDLAAASDAASETAFE